MLPLTRSSSLAATADSGRAVFPHLSDRGHGCLTADAVAVRNGVIKGKLRTIRLSTGGVPSAACRAESNRNRPIEPSSACARSSRILLESHS